MEKITLKPLSNEIVVNNGTSDGAVDLFCYTPDDNASRGLGALYVVGHRVSDSANMGYMVSLIAALARREYYAQPSNPPREAFARTLRKANEVVEEFFKSGDVKLSVGIVAVAAGQVMVSKLDKFKILLARDNQVIDILSNVLLFSKEHTERRRFSSIIHGSVQAGDRILAFVPTREVTTRERNLKSWFLKLPQEEFAQRVSQIGQEHASFATAMLHIDIAQSSEPALMPSPQPPELSVPPMVSDNGPITPSLASQTPPPSHAPLSWTPRQQSVSVVAHAERNAAAEEFPKYAAADSEVPHLIPSEFSQGTRRTMLSRMLGHIRFVRLDGRGKAISLALVALVVTGGVLMAKSLFIVSPQEKEASQALMGIRQEIELAKAKNAEGSASEARGILTRAMAALEGLGLANTQSVELSASIVSSLDAIDHAQPVQPTLMASPEPGAEIISLATWASTSQSLRVGGTTAGGGLWVATLRDGMSQNRSELGTAPVDLLIGWRDSVVSVNMTARTITRVVGGTVKPYIIPVEETVLDAAEFADSLYVLTDRSILKVSDLETDKPVTKRWLVGDDELSAGASRLFVDGSVYTMGRDGIFSSYYKGKKTSSVTVPLTPSGTWKLLPWSDGLFAVAVGDARRIYVFDGRTGTLERTLKVESQIPFLHVAPGPDQSALLLTSEGKLWQVQ